MTLSVRRLRPGFTLIELLVVISIIALLVSILLPALSAARSAAVAVECKSQMKQITLAAHMYLTDYDEWFPLQDWYYPDQPRPAFGRIGAIGQYLGHTREGRAGKSMATCPANESLMPADLNYAPTIAINTYLGTGYENGDVNLSTGAINPGSARPWTVDRRVSLKAEHEVMLFIDSYPETARAAGGWFFRPAVADTNVDKFHYPHMGSVSVAYVDGRAESKDVEDMQQLKHWSYPFWGHIYSKSRRHTSWALP